MKNKKIKIFIVLIVTSVIILLLLLAFLFLDDFVTVVECRNEFKEYESDYEEFVAFVQEDFQSLDDEKTIYIIKSLGDCQYELYREIIEDNQKITITEEMNENINQIDLGYRSITRGGGIYECAVSNKEIVFYNDSGAQIIYSLQGQESTGAMKYDSDDMKETFQKIRLNNRWYTFRIKGWELSDIVSAWFSRIWDR